MKNNKFWKQLMSVVLIGLILLPTGILANAPKLTSSSPKASKDITPVMKEYSKLAAKYLADCDSIHTLPRPAGDRLKYCLTVAKELRDKIIEVTKSLDTLIRNLKNAGKWTKELDDEFNNRASRSQINAEDLTQIRQGGGFREFSQKGNSDLKSSKSLFEQEINDLEAKIKKDASASIDFFQPISYQPVAEFNARGRLKLILKIVKAALDAATYVCTFTNLCT